MFTGLAMLLDDETINRKLQQLSAGWRRQGKRVVFDGRFANYVEAMSFAQAITPLAEAMGHHPDLEIGWGRCTVMLMTHDAGGLTTKDFELAAAIDGIRS